MFQYALALALEDLGYRIYFDIEEFDDDIEHKRLFELDKAFDLSAKVFRYPLAVALLSSLVKRSYSSANSGNLNSLIIGVMDKFARFIKASCLSSFRVVIDRASVDLESVCAGGNLFFIGYWQSSAYFSHIKDKVRERFTFKSCNSDPIAELLLQIEHAEAVSIHFRRGDYIENARFNKIYGGICTDRYYEEAIQYIYGHVNNPIFYIFSDDVGWVKTSGLLQGLREYRIIHSGEQDSWVDMMLMSICKHNIIANSSYSWWATWLNNNPNKITIAPSRWVNDYNDPGLSDLRNIYEKDWILVDP